MKDFFQKLNSKIRTAMVGRYGTDQLSRFLMTLALILLILSMFFRGGVLYLAALFLLVYSYFRVFSKNLYKRAAENTKYLSLKAKLQKKVRIEKRKFGDRKAYRYFKCPNCSQEVRVPKGKGHIRITCPKCRTQFDRRV